MTVVLGAEAGDTRKPSDIPDNERDYYPEESASALVTYRREISHHEVQRGL